MVDGAVNCNVKGAEYELLGGNNFETVDARERRRGRSDGDVGDDLRLNDKPAIG
jgi:hypothetical protein